MSLNFKEPHFLVLTIERSFLSIMCPCIKAAGKKKISPYIILINSAIFLEGIQRKRFDMAEKSET